MAFAILEKKRGEMVLHLPSKKDVTGSRPEGLLPMFSELGAI